MPLGAIPEGVDLPLCGETGFTSASTGCSSLPTSGLTSATAHREVDWLQLLLPPQESKQPKVFVGEGLPSIPAKLQERILRWEYIDFADLRPLGASGFEVSNPETGPQKLIVLPGMEVTKAKRKPVHGYPHRVAPSFWSLCSSSGEEVPRNHSRHDGIYDSDYTHTS